MDNNLRIFAIFLSSLALLMFVIPLLIQDWCKPFDLQVYAAFVGGTAGPLGSLAGFLFVYISYRESLAQNARQNNQFNIESFDQILLLLLEHHQNYSELEFTNQGGLHAEIDRLKPKLASYEGSIDDLRQAKFYTKRHFTGRFKELIMWVKSVTAMLVHIDNHRSLEIAETREDMILNLMSKEKKRCLFYFYFINDPEFNEIERNSLRGFLDKFRPKDLFNEAHKSWLQFE